MAATLDTTSFDAALKVHYTSDAIVNVCYEDHPFLAMVPKYEKFGGKNLPIPIRYGTPQGRSASFAKALANKRASDYEDFVLTRAKDYALADIDGETIDASASDPDAFMEAATSEIDGALQSLSGSISSALFRDGSGAIGRVVEVSGTTATLSDADDIVNFEVGMVVYFSSAGTVATLRDSGDTIAITAVNRSAGTLTLAEDLSTVSGITTLDYIHVEGDAGAKLKGLAAWVVYTGLTSASFFGVDRTVDATRLAGVPHDGSSESIDEALISGMNKVAREGGKPTHIFLNFSRYADLQKALQSKVQYVEHSVGDVGFQGMRIAGPKGFVDVYPDASCQSNRGWILDMRWWKLYSLGAAPKILMRDGNRMLRSSSADAYEVRTGCYLQLGCRAPGFNGVVNLPTS